MTSSDYMEAFDRLLQLNLQPVQEREIIRIILVCAGRVGQKGEIECRKSSTIRIMGIC